MMRPYQRTCLGWILLVYLLENQPDLSGHVGIDLAGQKPAFNHKKL